MWKKICISGLFILGLGIFLFPIVTNYLNNIVHYNVVENYQKQVSKLDKKALSKKKEEAQAYNKKLTEQAAPVSDPFGKKKQADKIASYGSILNAGSAMGYITIPKIEVELPIFHGSDDVVLSKGVGHLPNSSLPVGGIGTHAVLTGHRGLPSATMFRYLNKLKVGDKFYIHTLDNTLAYKVDQILVVLPDETEALAIDSQKDYVTLVTCDPYMINSHRLLVRGHRVAYHPTKVEKKQLTKAKQNPIWQGIYIFLGVIIVFLILLFLLGWKRRKRRVKE